MDSKTRLNGIPIAGICLLLLLLLLSQDNSIRCLVQDSDIPPEQTTPFDEPTNQSSGPPPPEVSSNLHLTFSPQTYLTDFGYHPANHSEVPDSGGQDENVHLSDSTKHFQWFLNYEPTGYSGPLAAIDEFTTGRMRAARCGNLDVEARNADFDPTQPRPLYVVNPEGSKWDHDEITYDIAEYPRKFQRRKGHTDSLFQRAFDVWSKYIPLKFTRDRSSPRVDIRIKFVLDDNAGDCERCKLFQENWRKVLAHANYPPSKGANNRSGGLAGAEIHFNDFIDWSIDEGLQDSGSVYLLPVAVHEIGHSLGLGHPPCPKAKMFPILDLAAAAAAATQTTLHPADITGIKRLYPPTKRAANKPKSPPEATTPAPPKLAEQTDETVPPASGQKEPEAKAGHNPPVCGTDGLWWFRGPTCKQYYDCTSGKPKLMTCRDNLLWRHEKIWCDFPENVHDCKD